MLQTINIGAGATVEFYEAGDFFRLLSATGAVTVKFYKNGQLLADSEGIFSGYSEKFGDFYDRFSISSVAGNTVQFVSRLGNEVSYDGSVSVSSGSFAVTNMYGAFAQATKTVTNASAQLSAAKADRRYWLLQNKDAAGYVYINFAGAVATTAGGIKVGPGGSFLLENYCATGAINAIGDIASNANVVVVEG